MGIQIEQSEQLRHLINGCSAYEGRYYLLQLFKELQASQRDPSELKSIADQLIALIQSINQLNQIRTAVVLDEYAIKKVMEDIACNYKELVKACGMTGIFYHAKEFVLALGGIICAIITSILGGIAGFAVGLFDDCSKVRIPTGALSGGLTGLLIGGIIGNNMPYKMFESSETRAIQHAIKTLTDTFQSLSASVKEDHVDMVKKELLHDSFGGDQALFDAFCQTDQQYNLLGVKAAFLSNKHKGTIGHHSLLTIEIKGKKNLIEWASPSTEDEIKDYSQIETRSAKGATLIKILAFHRLLQKQYTVEGKNAGFLIAKYRPGSFDCHTYLNIVLQAVGEESCSLNRFTTADTDIGRFIGKTLKFFSPVPEQRIYGTPVHNLATASEISTLAV
ncbi:MAG: hypothetical protein ACHP65_08960 [Legionellales bacterium]